jgi:hypothetical protein
MNRRALLKAAPAGLLALPAMLAPTKADAEETCARLLQVIADLESPQPWEPSSAVAAKAFAAWQMRKALGLNLPDPERAEWPIGYPPCRPP